VTEPSDELDLSFEVGLRRDLCRLARFGANLADAHSCFIFLPEVVLSNRESSLRRLGAQSETFLELVGFHSLCRDILYNCRLSITTGLIGWVAKHMRAIHVSPFERDSRTLGIYSGDQQLKSFIGIPLNLPGECASGVEISGVVACDSRKAFAFSKLQGKLLEDLAAEIGSTLQLSWRAKNFRKNSDSWHDFLRDTITLVDGLGRDSLEILRLKLRNFAELEQGLGTSETLKLVTQLQRLIKQALPSNFPVLLLCNGDIIIALDTMVSSFYENRINAICERIGAQGMKPCFQYSRRSARDKRYRGATVERLICDTSMIEESSSTKQGELYEFRRA